MVSSSNEVKCFFLDSTRALKDILKENILSAWMKETNPSMISTNWLDSVYTRSTYIDFLFSLL